MVRVIAVLCATLILSVAAQATSTPGFGPLKTVMQVGWDGWLGEIGVADVTGDGSPDIVGVKFLDGKPTETHPLVVLAGDGKGGFRDATTQIFVGSVPRTQHARRLLFADFNGDGRTDFFIADTRGELLRYRTAVVLDRLARTFNATVSKDDVLQLP